MESTMNTVTFQVPVTRLRGEYVTVTIDESRVREYAAHGIKQVVNDRASGIKRKDFADDESYVTEVMETCQAQADRISDGDHRLAGERGPRKPTPKDLAVILGALSDDELSALGVTRDAANALAKLVAAAQ